MIIINGALVPPVLVLFHVPSDIGGYSKKMGIYEAGMGPYQTGICWHLDLGQSSLQNCEA